LKSGEGPGHDVDINNARIPKQNKKRQALVNRYIFYEFVKFFNHCVLPSLYLREKAHPFHFIKNTSLENVA